MLTRHHWECWNKVLVRGENAIHTRKGHPCSPNGSGNFELERGEYVCH